VEDIVCGEGVLVVWARQLAGQEGYVGGHHCEIVATGRLVIVKYASLLSR
jgi:hypothetical protein